MYARTRLPVKHPRLDGPRCWTRWAIQIASARNLYGMPRDHMKGGQRAFILGDRTAIEGKTTGRDLRPRHVLAVEKKLRRYLCVCTEPRPRKVGVIEVVPC